VDLAHIWEIAIPQANTIKFNSLKSAEMDQALWKPRTSEAKGNSRLCRT